MRAPRNGPPLADLPGTDSDQTAMHGAGTVTANAACSTPVVPSARCCFQGCAWLIWLSRLCACSSLFAPG